MDISSFCAYATENLSDGHSYFTVKKTDLNSATDRQRRELYSKNRAVDAGMYLLLRRDEKKGMQFRSHIARTLGNLTHNAALTFPGKLRLEKI
jgi:hypothetical protein